MKKLSLAILLIIVMIFTTACGGGAATSTDPVPDTDNMQKRTDLLAQYRFDENVNQILFISHTTEWDAKAFFYEKSDINSAWVLVGEYDAYIGKNYMGKEGEGDAKTPYGEYTVTSAFGILPNPGTTLNYIDVLPTTYLCDEDSEFYNQIIDVEATGHECNGEEMYALSPVYNYGMTIDFNKENVYPNGSGIFLHCKGQKPYTGGCISFDQDVMVTLLQHATAGMKVYLDEYYIVEAE